jgi:cell division septum initiation protein DivIVA
MTAMTDVTQQLRDLEEQELSAWMMYRERLRELTGVAYERAEDECWQELQRELRRLSRRRRLLESGPTRPTASV